MTLRSEWDAAGPPGHFNLYENARTAEMFDELAERIRSLEGQERAETEQALVNAFNLYFFKFEEGTLRAKSLEDIKAAFGEKTDLTSRSISIRSSLNLPANWLNSARPIALAKRPSLSLPSQFSPG
jgi:hypothetical protein